MTVQVKKHYDLLFVGKGKIEKSVFVCKGYFDSFLQVKIWLSYGSHFIGTTTVLTY